MSYYVLQRDAWHDALFQIVPRRKSLGWLFYFFVQIGFVGGVLCSTIIIPLLALGFFLPACRQLGERWLARGIRLLLFLEPWLSAEVRLTIPKGSFSISNHRSHLDTFFLLARIPGVRLVCKKSLFRIPFLALMMRLSRQIPIERGNQESYWEAMEKVRRALQTGDSVHIFPEMARCPSGTGGTQAFHLAPFHIAFQERKPVIPVAISGTDGVWPKGQLRLRFRRPVRIEALAPVYPADFSSASAMAAETRSRIDRFLGANP